MAYHAVLKQEFSQDDVVVANAVRFLEKIKDGRHEGKYKVIILGFDQYGRSVELWDDVIAPDGYPRILGKTLLPLETSQDSGPVENIQAPKVIGNWKLGNEPQSGEERLIIYRTKSDDIRAMKLFSADASRKISDMPQNAGLFSYTPLDIVRTQKAMEEGAVMLKHIQQYASGACASDIFELQKAIVKLKQIEENAGVGLKMMDAIINSKG